MDSDLTKWHATYQSCQLYFVNHGQYTSLVQAIASLTNIRLPYQWATPVTQMHYARTEPSRKRKEVSSSTTTVSSSSNSALPSIGHSVPVETPAVAAAKLPFVSLVHYLRRLIVTGHDSDHTLAAFFGSEWESGLARLRETERTNYMFSAKSTAWTEVRKLYDVLPDQTVPHMVPLASVDNAEIERAERQWSEWLAMEDWMLGPRAPGSGAVDGNGTVVDAAPADAYMQL